MLDGTPTVAEVPTVVDWEPHALADELLLMTGEAKIIVETWADEASLVEDFEKGKSLTDYDGITHSIAATLRCFIRDRYPEAARRRREALPGIATEFGITDQPQEGKSPHWWYVCPACNSRQERTGDPQTLAGRAVGCRDCNRVNVLSGPDMDLNEQAPHG